MVVRRSIELFNARGYDAVTVEEIAHASGISRRTFFRHFATKEEVIFAWLQTEALLMETYLLDRLRDEPIRATISTAFLNLADYHDRVIGAPRMEIGLALETSSLRDRYYGEARKWQARFENVLIGHRGHDKIDHLTVEMQMAAGVSAYMAAVLHWSRSGGAGKLRDWVVRCLDAIW